MGTVRKSITFTSKQDNWIRARVANGDFTNDSEYIRNLVRKDQDENMRLAELRQAIDEGLQSGKSNLTIPEIMRLVDEGKL